MESQKIVMSQIGISNGHPATQTSVDIRRTIPGNLRSLVTNIPASSVYSVRSGSTKSRTVSVSDSPLATSSNASSEPSVNNNSHYLDGSEEVEENVVGNERAHSSSPSSLQDE